MKNSSSAEDPIYAGLLVRLMAALIDVIIMTPIVWAVARLIGAEPTQMPSFNEMLEGVSPPEATTAQRIANFLSWIIVIAYSVYFIISKKQATPGKRMMNIYVATKDGQKLSVNRASARILVSILSATLFLFGVALLTFAFIYLKTVSLSIFSYLFISIIVLFVSSLCMYGLLIIAFTKEKTALHDIICGTRVFYGKKN